MEFDYNKLSKGTNILYVYIHIRYIWGLMMVIDTTLLQVCYTVCQWLVTGQWFYPVLFTNKIDHHDIAEILLEVALNSITPKIILMGSN
jgi:hypothetical protein